jgi:hypothetical protein
MTSRPKRAAVWFRRWVRWPALDAWNLSLALTLPLRRPLFWWRYRVLVWHVRQGLPLPENFKL